MDEQYFNVTLEDGSEQKCRVILTFDSNDHSYVLYTLVDENGHESEEVSALRFELGDNGEMTNFTSLETEEEWDMVDEVLNTLVAEFGDGDEDYFTISTEEDEEVLCEIIHRFELADFNKSYILYAYADQEEINEIFASAYTPGEQGEVVELLPIETDQEWEFVEKELASINNQQS
ncbi:MULTISPECIES: DUF1292 domain-containing protein [Lysinibacillus]|uniref:UPF0473 protein EK386_01330 n=1 Tax=Lysinibacillus antri TaxID=2498145 RepID=A0A432LGJ9_9BACI|nr:MULTISPECIES: DUF1292 domain-containing protein [Lysinibacillus]RUL57089.1 DUF1292 domain-containing protein [Lysinibacillus antri]TSI03277.1 DUF1292 domain-containing protein [Lysinibacillus sp. BW-2-10]